MKKKMSILVLVTLLLLLATNFAFASNKANVEVRANGYLLDCKEDTPFIDNNNRTLMPLRLLAEALGAEVSWDKKNVTATISKNNLVVKAKVNEDNLFIEDKTNNTTKVLKMDSKVVLKKDRIYLPLRAISESLNAYVGWSNYYKTIDIYQDILSKEEIIRLQSYKHCVNEGGRYFESASDYYANKEINKSFQDKEYGFLNAHEFILRYKAPTKYVMYGELTNSKWSINEDNQGMLYVKEAIALTNKEISAKGVKAEFKADVSTLYQDSYYDGLHYSVRGVLKVSLDKNKLDKGKETLKWLNIDYVTGVMEYERDFEVRVQGKINAPICVSGYYLLEE